MIETIFKTSDGKEFKDKKDAIEHETCKQRDNYVQTLANYYYFRFNDHRQNVRLYLQYKHITLEEFKKLAAYHNYSNTQARKKLWELRNLYKDKVKEGEKKIKEKKSFLQKSIAQIKKEEAIMKKM
jgi:DNA-binding transcriptional MerR regulator